MNTVIACSKGNLTLFYTIKSLIVGINIIVDRIPAYITAITSRTRIG